MRLGVQPALAASTQGCNSGAALPRCTRLIGQWRSSVINLRVAATLFTMASAAGGAALQNLSDAYDSLEAGDYESAELACLRVACGELAGSMAPPPAPAVEPLVQCCYLLVRHRSAAPSARPIPAL